MNKRRRDEDGPLDPIAMEVFSNRLLSITEDMGNTLIRSSFSTNIKERRDCSVALFDGKGRLVAQASHVPLHLGSLMGSVSAVLDAVDIEEMRDGDAFICNDPYLAGGTHLPDVSIVTPVFWDGEVRFFCANIAHHSDFGGAVPGSIAGGLRSIFEEGLRIPVIRLVHAGKMDDALLNLIAHNTRDPNERTLDLKVQVATNERGASSLLEMFRQLGASVVEQSIEDILAYTSRRLRNRVKEMNDGFATGEAQIDDDGLGGDPVTIKATVRISGDRLTVDFNGSDPEARGAMNVAESAARATVYYAVKVLLDPNLLPNSGMFDAIDVKLPDGSIINPRFPAAVGARSITCNKIARAIFMAFVDLLPPEKALASGFDAVPAIVFSGDWPDRPGSFVYLETMAGGAGAGATHDGMDAVQVHMTNTSNLPAEALENEYPLMVVEYALVPNSGGAGEFRGGLGLAREIKVLQDDIVFSVRSDGHKAGAPGVFGGQPGGTARLIQNRGMTNEQELSSKVARLQLIAGETIRLQTPGGGGYGDPRRRPAEHTEADIRQAKVAH